MIISIGLFGNYKYEELDVFLVSKSGKVYKQTKFDKGYYHSDNSIGFAFDVPDDESEELFAVWTVKIARFNMPEGWNQPKEIPIEQFYPAEEFQKMLDKDGKFSYHYGYAHNDPKESIYYDKLLRKMSFIESLDVTASIGTLDNIIVRRTFVTKVKMREIPKVGLRPTFGTVGSVNGSKFNTKVPVYEIPWSDRPWYKIDLEIDPQVAIDFIQDYKEFRYDDTDWKEYNEPTAGVEDFPQKEYPSFLNYYLIEPDNYKKLSNSKFIFPTPDMGNYEQYFQDYYKYVLACHSMPILLPQNAIGVVRENIVLKNQKVRNSEVLIINYPIVSYNLGHVKAIERYGNTLDYEGVTCKIMLPFVANSIELPPNVVIGRQLNFFADLDLLTGDLHYTIKDDDGYLVANAKVTISTPAPLQMNESLDSVVTSGSKFIYNEIESPLIRVIRPIAKNVSKFLVGRYGRIGDAKGLVKSGTLDVKSPALSHEKELIDSLIRGGIVIQ